MHQQEQQKAAAEFSAPRHWLGVEELSADYWADPQVREKRAQEFYDKPIETIGLIDRLDTKGIARRDFLTLMGASMAMAGAACARRPVHKIIPYVVKPEEVTPGVANWYASTLPETGSGILIKTREGRPIKLEGNPDHPVNRGTLTGREQGALLDLYDMDRLQEPMERSRRDGSVRKATWKEADQAIGAKLRAAASGGRVRLLTGAVLGDSQRRLVQEFMSAAGSAAGHVEFEPISFDGIAAAQAESYGTTVVPRYRFDRADVIVSLGADFIGAWLSPSEYAAGWASNRRLDDKNARSARLSKMVVFESDFTVTGANADERYPVRPGDEFKVAMALAHELIVTQKRSKFSTDGAVENALSGYSAEAVAKDLGLHGGAATLKELAHDLWNARGKSLVVGGGLASQGRNPIELQIAINLLNSALDNEGATVDGTHQPSNRTQGGVSGLARLISEINAGSVDVLIIHGANPVYTAPANLGVAAALKKVAMVVAITDRDDETAEYADWVLPNHHFLENWGDCRLRKGLLSVQQPAIAPLYGTRAFEDSLLVWIRGAGWSQAGLAGKVAFASGEAHTWHDYLKANWREGPFKQKGAGSFESFWENVLREGVLVLGGEGSGGARSFKSASVARLSNFAPTSAGLKLALYSKVSMHDGRQANNPWLQEMPDPVSTITWDNYANISPKLAQEMSLKNNDVVSISMGDQTMELPVNVQPGLHPQVVAVAVGYGRTRVGKVGNGVGLNLYPWAKFEKGYTKYSGHDVTVRKTGKLYKLAQTQWHHASENRPVINDISLAQFKKSPSAANHTDPHLRMENVPTLWPKHSFPGHRWGMAIDLNTCTGCGACVVACQAENNVPVVGRENVRVSREMHWIRLDRYYSGSPDRPNVIFQPMLCQHCENAPCETVCPVLATVHNSEGMNEQVYNRCVGTRYCQNNCPYKVRRFNFFDHWVSYQGNTNMVWNPEVTVRTRGIMEKCSFCVQRVRDAKDHAKDAGAKLKDGDVVAACQQTCPTNAIVFGDINDPKSRVSKMQGDARAFRVLEVLNTKPSISYLTKVRNQEEASSHG